MTASLGRIMFWAPRVLSIAFVAFLSLFALDVFSEGRAFWPTVLALLIHLIPSAILVLVVALAWRWEWIGAVLFAGVGFLYLATAWKHPTWVLLISGPLFLIAALYLLDWAVQRQAHLHG
jgi:hypothetical protein